MTDSTLMKVCGECKAEKPSTDFYPAARSKDGLQRTCKACQSLYRQANRERINARQRRRAEANREHDRAVRKVWEEGPGKEWREQYKPRRRELVQGYNKRDRAKNTAAMRAWREKNPEAARAASRRHRAKYPERDRARASFRQARKRATRRGSPRAILRVTEAIKSAPGLRCYWCGRKTPPEERHVDHIIPLSKGGIHAAENLCCSCATCNCSKGAKLPHEFKGQAEIAF